MRTSSDLEDVAVEVVAVVVEVVAAVDVMARATEMEALLTSMINLRSHPLLDCFSYPS